MAIGEAGTITTNSPGENTPIRIDFTDDLTNPVIALTSTNNGGNQFTLRVIDSDDTGFTFIIEEWEYHDGPHPATETINWLAIEEGVHTLPDGRMIEAGTASATHNSGSVSLSGGFTTPPVVLTSVMSENDTTTIDSDPRDITASGFNLRLQEEEAQDGNHAIETVGWIAIEPGGGAESGTATTSGGFNHNVDTYALGDTFDDPIILAETQTINGGDPATIIIEGETLSTVDLSLEEEQSGDSETNHTNETVGIVAFEDGIIPCFTVGTLIDTARGPRPVETLRPGDLILTRDHGPQPLRWLCRTHLPPDRLARDPHLRPVRIRRDAFGPGCPARDMAVSPQHRLLITGWRAELFFGSDEILVAAKALLNDISVRLDPGAGPVGYFHLLLDRHEVVTADGLLTESLHAGQIDKAELTGPARHELFALFPTLRSDTGAFGRTARPVARVHEARILA